MDNNKNRIFDGKLSMDLVNTYPTWFKPISDVFLKCKIRCYTMEDVEKINKLYNPCKPVKFVQKKNSQNTESTDHVIEYKFNVMDFTNKGSSDIEAYHIVYITFMDNLDMIKNKLKQEFTSVKSKIQKNTLSIQINKPEIQRGYMITEPGLKVKYPIAILSFNRANDKDGLTHKLLTKMRIQHNLFIEPQHEEMYKNWYDPEYCELIVSPRNFSEDKMGSCRVRTYICEYFNTHDRVWMLDDNIKHYGRLQSGIKNKVEGAGIFTSVEEYIKQYDNVGLVSHNYWPFITEGSGRSCIVKNGKCFSSILCPTDAVWKYKYEEDTLLSIEYIQQGKCNLCFNHILYDKPTSGISKGGNQDSLYNNGGYKTKLEYLMYTLKIMEIEGRLDFIKGKTSDDLCKCQSLKTKKYHHKMDYKVLKGRNNKLVRKLEYESDSESVHKCEVVFMTYDKYEEHQKIIQVEKIINDSLTEE